MQSWRKGVAAAKICRALALWRGTPPRTTQEGAGRNRRRGVVIYLVDGRARWIEEERHEERRGTS
jgi:hypothetical protein